MKHGVYAGFGAGIVFGIIMQIWGDLSGVAKLVGSSSVWIGWLVHLVIGAVLGALYALVFKSGNHAVNGLIYGIVWYILGPLTLMPLVLGQGLQWSGQAIAGSWSTLVGHLVYGLVLGFVYSKLSGDEAAPATTGTAEA